MNGVSEIVKGLPLQFQYVTAACYALVIAIIVGVSLRKLLKERLETAPGATPPATHLELYRTMILHLETIATILKAQEQRTLDELHFSAWSKTRRAPRQKKDLTEDEK